MEQRVLERLWVCAVYDVGGICEVLPNQSKENLLTLHDTCCRLPGTLGQRMTPLLPGLIKPS